MTKEEVIVKLKEIELYFAGDPEIAHLKADEVLLEYVDEEVRQAYLDLQEKCEFWYA